MSEDDLDCFDCAFPVYDTVTDGLVAQGHDPLYIAMALCQALVNLGVDEEIDVEGMLADVVEGCGCSDVEKSN